MKRGRICCIRRFTRTDAEVPRSASKRTKNNQFSGLVAETEMSTVMQLPCSSNSIVEDPCSNMSIAYSSELGKPLLARSPCRFAAPSLQRIVALENVSWNLLIDSPVNVILEGIILIPRKCHSAWKSPGDDCGCLARAVHVPYSVLAG